MRKRQQGVTLILSLIMLVLLTIMALSSLNIGRSGLQIVDNAQQQTQAANAAQSMIDQVISTPTFADAPGSVLDNSNCPATHAAPPNSRCVDMYGDGKTVVVVAMSPQPACVQTRTIPSTELDLAVSEDLGCALGIQQNFGIAGVSSGASLCSNTMWEVNAAASEPVSRAQAVVTQGVAMRVSTDAAATSCP